MISFIDLTLVFAAVFSMSPFFMCKRLVIMNEGILVIELGIIFGLFTGIVLTIYCFVKNICQKILQIERRQIFLEREVSDLKSASTEQEVQFS